MMCALQWPSGRRYDGDWKNDKRNGQGVYTVSVPVEGMVHCIVVSHNVCVMCVYDVCCAVA